MTDMSAILIKESAKFLNGKLTESLAKKQADWVVSSLAEASNVGTCVAVALLSLALKRQPLDDEVQDFLGRLVGDPSAPARVRRLLGEMLMSPSRKRRARLAAVFVAGPSISSTSCDRDRLDALVERMLDDDVEALRQFVACDSTDGVLMEEPHRQASVSGRRHFCSVPFARDAAKSGQAMPDLPTLSTLVLDNLEALGVIRAVGGFSQDVQLDSGHAIFIPYFVTALGRFLQASLQHEAIRKGMAVVGAE